jgi:hypothetical protein
MTKERATVLQRVVAGPRRFSSPSVGRGPITTQDDGFVVEVENIWLGSAKHEKIEKSHRLSG